VISGTEYKTSAAKLFLHIISFLGNHIDHITSFSNMVKGNDFILFEAEDSELLNYHPNIALITGIVDENKNSDYLKTIVGGGIVIYNAEDQNLAGIIESSENFFRKIPYQNPEFHKMEGQNFLNTDLGEIPVHISGENLSYVEGVKHLCQHIGIMEEDFYEALTEF